jgi:hypothetical protein
MIAAVATGRFLSPGVQLYTDSPSLSGVTVGGRPNRTVVTSLRQTRSRRATEPSAVELLEETLEEKKTDEALTELAEASVNQQGGSVTPRRCSQWAR